MSRIKVFLLIVVSVLVLSGCKSAVNPSVDSAGETGVSEQVQETAEVGAATVTVTDEGVASESVTVKAGESVTWVNNSQRVVQIGSDDHPSHTNNPGLTGGEFVIELQPGESKTASVGTEVGTWEWHDHLKSSVGGVVVVE